VRRRCPFENVLVALWWLWLLGRFCWRGSGWGVVRLRDWEIRWGQDDRVDLVVVVGEVAFVVVHYLVVHLVDVDPPLPAVAVGIATTLAHVNSLVTGVPES
jgi:hypothetical protein